MLYIILNQNLGSGFPKSLSIRIGVCKHQTGGVFGQQITSYKSDSAERRCWFYDEGDVIFIHQYISLIR